MKQTKVIIHFVDGSSRPYHFNDCYIKDQIDWDNNTMTLAYTYTHPIPDEIVNVTGVMAVEQHTTYNVMYFTNPLYNLSIQTSIMTAKQRARLNNNQQVDYVALIFCRMVRKILRFLKEL